MALPTLLCLGAVAWLQYFGPPKPAGKASNRRSRGKESSLPALSTATASAPSVESGGDPQRIESIMGASSDTRSVHTLYCAVIWSFDRALKAVRFER